MAGWERVSECKGGSRKRSVCKCAREHRSGCDLAYRWYVCASNGVRACPWINLSALLRSCWFNGCINARAAALPLPQMCLRWSKDRKRSDFSHHSLQSQWLRGWGLAWNYSQRLLKRKEKEKKHKHKQNLWSTVIHSPLVFLSLQTWLSLWSLCCSAPTGFQSMLSTRAKNITWYIWWACLQDLILTGWGSLTEMPTHVCYINAYFVKQPPVRL